MTLPPYAHELAHTTRSAELRAQAAAHARAATAPDHSRYPKPHPGPLQTRIGWLLVETGLRLVRPPAREPLT